MDRLRKAAAPAALSFFVLLLGCGVTQGTQPPASTPPPAQPAPVATTSGSVTITPAYVALGPGQQVQFSASSTISGAFEWLVNGTQGGKASTGTIDASGLYTAPSSLAQSENVVITAALAASPQQNNATAVASLLEYGNVYPTSNPQVDDYSIDLPAPGKVSVQFGPTDSYGRDTWQVPTPTANGGQVDIEVAGMLPQTLYHMRAQVVLTDGAVWNDIDHSVFASGLPLRTGSPPQTSPVTVSGSGTPQPGIELWNTILPAGDAQAFATDLQGHVLWTYTYKGSAYDDIQGIQLLPDGDFLMVISYLSSLPPQAVAHIPNTLNLVREVDLAGNTIRQITMDQLNQRLATAGFHDSDGSAYQLRSFHHSAIALPNGHWVVLASDPKTFTNLPGYPGSTSVLGDVLVDLDQNLNPDWVWNAFDHLDVNRHPMLFPDWTHSNDVLYSTDDHNLLLSVRHQNWIIKIDFDDGQGSGNILWRLGDGGDFKLLDANGDTDSNPADWFYAQHGPAFFSQNTTGVFRLGLMDNGNDRIFAAPTGQVLCKSGGASVPQCYSTFPILEVNENNMTATILSREVPPPSDFSFFGGDAQWLANGDGQINFAAPTSGGMVQEFDPSGQLVWQGTTTGADQFRVLRLPSLYPGVQW